MWYATRTSLTILVRPASPLKTNYSSTSLGKQFTTHVYLTRLQYADEELQMQRMAEVTSDKSQNAMPVRCMTKLVWSLCCRYRPSMAAALRSHSHTARPRTATFLQRVSIASCYAKRCISYRKCSPTVWPSVRHTLVSSQNDLSYDHGVFTSCL